MSEIICEDLEHNYAKTSRGYYKLDGGVNFVGKTYDHSITYTTLFCTRCGHTKEIVSQDHRTEAS